MLGEDISYVSNAFEAALQAFAHTSYQSMLERINKEPKLKENEAELKKCVEDFLKTGTY